MADEAKVSSPKRSAAGVPSVVHSLRQALSEMGPRRSLQALLAANQTHGFDCPSCAWPDPDDRKTAEFCENGAKAVAWEATRKRVDAAFFAEHSIDDLRAQTDHWLESQGRLTEPMHRPAGGTHYQPIGWDAALALVAGGLRALPDPNRAAFYTSGRTSNEAAFTYQLLARRFGTNNLPDCSNMCHESSGFALTQTLGIGKGTVRLVDIADHAELIVIVGQNPGTNHPRMLSALEAAKRRGARIVAINPLPEAGLIKFRNPQSARGLAGPGTKLADQYLPVRVNGDLALFGAVNRILLEREDAAPGTILDRDFIDAYCDGFDPAAAGWSKLDFADLLPMTGLAREAIEAFVDEVVAARSIVVCWAMGLTQHRNAVATIREITNFLLLRGNVGRPGAGACPVRGHSNVQGDRTMGIYEKPDGDFLDRLGAAAGFEPPRDHGHDVVDAIRAMRDGRAHVFMAMGGNFAAAAPDTEATARALRNTRLTVHVSTKPNRSHLVTGRQALILPTLGRSERDERDGAERAVSVVALMLYVWPAERPLKAVSASATLLTAPPICQIGKAVSGDLIRSECSTVMSITSSLSSATSQARK
jgi:molybdopterin-dependent oxidoreductase alpha subunit